MKKIISIAVLALTVSAFAGLQTPINNVSMTGTNTYNLPGVSNTNYSSAPVFTTVNNRHTLITLTVAPGATNAQSVGVAIMASADNVNWVQPSTLGSFPNYVAGSFSLSTNTSTVGTNFDGGAIPFWCVQYSTNSVINVTNIVSLKVFTKNGGI